MKTVYLVRHGETSSNLNRISGQPDDPLTERGIRQTLLLAERLRDVPLNAVISSPYTRARQTAEAIAVPRGLEIVFSDLFIEIRSPKEVEGKPHADPEANKIREIRHSYWGEKDKHYSTEENFFDASDRAEKALDFLMHRPEEQIAVATHGGFMRVLLGALLLGPLHTPQTSTRIYEHTFLSNTGITVIQYQGSGKWRLIRWNDTVHLDPEAHSW